MKCKFSSLPCQVGVDAKDRWARLGFSDRLLASASVVLLLTSMVWTLSPTSAQAAEVTRLSSGRPATGDSRAAVVVDQVMDQFMDLIHCQAATITVTQGQRTIVSRGYGWRDCHQRFPTQPDTLMRIASCAKPITAAAVHHLIRDGVIRQDQPIGCLLGFDKCSTEITDARWHQITVRHLLEHRAGFDRQQTFDPMFRLSDVEKSLGLKRLVTTRDIIRFMLTRPLQFTPGDRQAYSNFGYAMLGRVIENVTGTSYLEYVQQTICQPLDIEDLYLSRSRRVDRPVAEVTYPVEEDAFSLEVMDAHGGLTTSTPSLCKFMSAYWMSGQLRKPRERQSWTFFGSLPGTTAMMLQRPDGINCAVLLNGRRNEHFNQDNQRLKEQVNQMLDRLLVTQDGNSS